MQFMVTFSSQLTISSLYKLAVPRAIFCPTLHHQNTDVTACDVTATCNHARSGYSLNRFDTTALGSMGFISLRAKPHKTHVLCTWFYEALLGLLNPVDSFHLKAFEFMMILCEQHSSMLSYYRPCIFPSPSFPISLFSYHF